MCVNGDVEPSRGEMQREATAESFGRTGDENTPCHEWKSRAATEESVHVDAAFRKRSTPVIAKASFSKERWLGAA